MRCPLLLKMAIVLATAVAAPPVFAANDPPAEAAVEKKSGAEDSMNVLLRAPLASPLFSDTPVALVNDEPIRFEELKNALLFSHADGMEESGKAPKVDFRVFLDRLITIRLFVQEARNIGIDELPEISSTLENFSGSTLRQLYVARQVKDLKPEQAEIERIYKENITEWKIRSVLFKKKKHAKKMAADVRGGKTFEKAAAQPLQEGTAKGSDQAAWVRAKTLEPAVAETISKMKPGSVSPVIPMGPEKVRSYSLVKLEETRYAESDAEREKAERQAEGDQRQSVLEKHKKKLYKKHAWINKKLLGRLDYEAKKPGMDKLLKDRRVIARVSGKPVTVGELTAELKQSFYHGADIAAKSKKINREKKTALEEIIDRRVLKQEALREGIDKTREYQALVGEFEANFLFGAFVSKVLKPEVVVTAEEKKAYYQEHLKEFTPPPSMKLSSLAFAEEKDAKKAFEKLRKRADFRWLKENAEGQLGEESDDILDGKVVPVADFSPSMRKALDGAQAGDIRLAESPKGHFVFVVEEIIQPGPLPFEQVESFIEKKVAAIHLDTIAKQWSDRLRKLSKIKVYLADTSK